MKRYGEGTNHVRDDEEGEIAAEKASNDLSALDEVVAEEAARQKTSAFSCKLQIITGRGLERRVVKVARNIDAIDRSDAIAKVTTWACKLGLGIVEMMNDEDSRMTFDISLGAEMHT